MYLLKVFIGSLYCLYFFKTDQSDYFGSRFTTQLKTTLKANKNVDKTAQKFACSTFTEFVTSIEGFSRVDIKVKIQNVGFQGIPGETGESGTPGARGLKGNQGPPGMRGPNGLVGNVGPTGRDGEKGDIGNRGRPGEPGSPGAKGIMVWDKNPVWYCVKYGCLA